MLQAALFLLASGLCRHMWSINASVAYTLIGFTGFGAMFYIAIVIAGTSSYACPFQTPASATLRRPWKRIQHVVKPVLLPIVRVLKRRSWPLLRGPWMRVRRGTSSSGRYFKRVLRRIIRVLKQRVWPLLRHPLLPIAIPVRNVQVREPKSWLKPKDLAIICRTNANNVGCVSWILWNITDPEALDVAIRLAGTIRWFDGGTNTDPPYDFIVSTLEACFDPAGKLYPGSRDKAYYSGRAMVWIRVRAMHKSREFSRRFPPSYAKYEGLGLDPDLRHLLHHYTIKHICQLSLYMFVLNSFADRANAI